MVKLENESYKKIAQFPMGMKQRLGISLSLLGNRELLILDEPTNGLDPKGINEVRELLLMLNNEYGITIFTSIHILSEIDRLVTDLAIINKGAVLFDGKIETLRKKNKSKYILDTSNNNKAMQILCNFSPTQRGDQTLELSTNSKEEKAKINKMIIENGLDLYAGYSKSKSLEDIFLDMTN